MPPSIEEFKTLLLERPPEELVRRFVFAGTPYAFQEHPETEDVLNGHLCSALRVTPQNVIIVGSGKIGFSLNPDNFPRQFSEESDIDVAIVDEELFDSVWLSLLRWHYPRRLIALGAVDGEWSRLRRKDVYWGWFAPDKIRFEGLSFPEVLKPLRDISTQWFNAFKALSQYAEFTRRNVSGRLYRTWDLALLYHAEGLRQISTSIRATQKGT